MKKKQMTVYVHYNVSRQSARNDTVNYDQIEKVNKGILFALHDDYDDGDGNGVFERRSTILNSHKATDSKSLTA